MRFEKQQEIATRATVYMLRIEDWELMNVKLDAFDIGLIKECDGSPAIADKLLALETIVRKIEIANGVKQP